ncbi:predicted protein [Sclerotinia sclerotiorum 1980 UF-70]|uniref:Uncharacterized protein n=1 Tax=Sclerotinia sclerotiorum (strain ATCC 18683 / 1980 / Ss-1) TaxID=665079 RepID=A7EPA8_SCLS1|nr:predicted protein [Sclerotinia sclerotiorum 1980 UF-70]EDO04674.1 predicted protein [Sclerotinia sclerotiorum 1980 UF-70]
MFNVATLRYILSHRLKKAYTEICSMTVTETSDIVVGAWPVEQQV